MDAGRDCFLCTVDRLFVKPAMEDICALGIGRIAVSPWRLPRWSNYRRCRAVRFPGEPRSSTPDDGYPPSLHAETGLSTLYLREGLEERLHNDFFSARVTDERPASFSILALIGVFPPSLRSGEFGSPVMHRHAA